MKPFLVHAINIISLAFAPDHTHMLAAATAIGAKKEDVPSQKPISFVKTCLLLL
jgi:hypothetical protein